ncbi:unnamed protein product [Periconia digitata]|uniref:Uncharacterized protein n=1 Tax=Periconia digitata TaxID=1303443 RepID=A0A9W4UTN0_9PLEO|nr:unnamed protein product [Periconia digitata]
MVSCLRVTGICMQTSVCPFHAVLEINTNIWVAPWPGAESKTPLVNLFDPAYFLLNHVFIGILKCRKRCNF